MSRNLQKVLNIEYSVDQLQVKLDSFCSNRIVFQIIGYIKEISPFFHLLIISANAWAGTALWAGVSEVNRQSHVCSNQAYSPFCRLLNVWPKAPKWITCEPPKWFASSRVLTNAVFFKCILTDSCYELNFVLPCKIHVEVQPLSTLECDLIWKEGHCRCN